MNKFKKILSATVAFLMLICCFTTVPLEVFAVTSTDGSTFELDSKGESYILTGVAKTLVGEVVVPDSYNGLPVTTIGNGAFTYCEEITLITIPETVTTIEGVAFQKCTSLQTINLPKTIKSIASSAFNYCCSLQNITIDNNINGHGDPFIDKNGNEKGKGYFVRDGVLFANYNTYVDNNLVQKNINHNSLIKYPSGRAESTYTISSDIMEIQSEAFSSLVKLETIIVPASVISFYVRSFRGLGEPHEKPLTIVMEHDTYPSDISSKTFQNLYPGTQVVLKNSSIAEAFNNQYNKIVYDFLHDDPGVTFISKATVPCDHEATSIINASEVKCNVDGYTGDKVCDSCNVVLVKGSVIDASGCNYVTEPSKVATCTEAGCIGAVYCSVCGDVNSFSETIPATGHCYGEWIVEVEGSCTENGYRHKVCSFCGDIVSEVISAKGHNSSDWIIDTKATVNAAGEKHKECTDCGEILETAEIPQLKCSKPKLKTIANTQSGVKIIWGKVSGADKYRVYRKTSKSDWKYIGTTSKTYYTDKTAKSGTKYYYAIKARNEAGNSSLSSSISKYYLADPVLETPKSTKSGVKLEWSKVRGAQGYYVYRKTSSGEWKRIATIKSGFKISYTDTGAQKGKKYTYKVKAYYSKTYSAYSNTMTIKDKY